MSRKSTEDDHLASPKLPSTESVDGWRGAPNYYPEFLSEEEIAQLRRRGAEMSEYARKAYADLRSQDEES